MTDRHTCLRCIRCDSTRGCPEGDGRVTSCGQPACFDCDCPCGCDTKGADQ